MKLSQRLTVACGLAILAAAALMLPGQAARAWTDADIVVFAVQPATAQANTAMTPAVVVYVEEPDGSLDRAYHGPVTLGYAVNPVGAPDPEHNVVSAVNGVARFPDLTFTAVGFGFELRASVSGGTASPASAPFDIVDQLLRCRPGQACRSERVSSSGTSAFATAAAAPASDTLAATGGGFPLLSCTRFGGVVSFSVRDRSKVITLTLANWLVRQAHRDGAGDFNICWGSPAPFTTKYGTRSAFNPANDEFEGLLPACRPCGPGPCIRSREKNQAGQEVTTVFAPPGDPHITY